MVGTFHRFTSIIVMVFLCSAPVYGDTFGTPADQFTIPFVTIGDPGNLDDSGTTGSYYIPYGSVDHVFRMSTYEISRDMIEKANTIGQLNITLADMSGFGGNAANHPATGVSWNEAARFVNWLNEQAGFSPAYKFTYQPGSTHYDANDYPLLWSASDAGYDPNNLFRNANARYYLPSEDEWYKAAYYSGESSTYFDYATRQDAPNLPTAVSEGISLYSAVYEQSSTDGPADINLAGGPSHYGTIGQNGNVAEWLESAYDGVNNSRNEGRCRRGGSWADTAYELRSSTRISRYSDPADEFLNIGFRVASDIPEPATGVIILGVAIATLLLRPARRC